MNLSSLEPIPFSNFHGVLKQYKSTNRRMSDYSLMRAFPEFLMRDKATWGIVKSLWPLASESDRTIDFRRFGGFDPLPRSRYMSVCIDPNGEDGQTLALELWAYASPKLAGDNRVFDLSDSKYCTLVQTPYVDEDGLQMAPITKPRQGIMLQFRASKNSLNPYVQHILERFGDIKELQLSKGLPFQQFVPYNLCEYNFPKVIDLRRHKVQIWFEKLITLAFAKILLRADHGTPRSVQGVDKTQIEKIRDSGLLNFPYALSMLMIPSHGGSLLTHLIGHVLRRVGANALIYPSARSDCNVINSNGIPKSFRGWNLVDYRDAPAVEDAPWGTLFQTKIEDIWMPISGVDYKHFQEAELQGSWAVTGNEAAHIRAYLQKISSL